MEIVHDPDDGLPLRAAVAEATHWIEAHRVEGVRASLDDLTGLDRAKRAIQALAWGMLHPAEIRAAGGRVPHAVLLAGPPGNGRTSLARALAGTLGERAEFLEFAASELDAEWMGALGRYTERRLP